MKVVDRKPVPIYEAECYECHSKIEYKASEVSFTGYITCPVCGMSIWGDKSNPVRMDGGENESNIYCDRNLCTQNEYNGIECDECQETRKNEVEDGI